MQSIIFLSNHKIQFGLKVMSILVVMIIATGIVYVGGGTSTSLPHIMYLPILLGAYFFSHKGGILTAFLSGLLLGPYMPMNVALKLEQPKATWLIRLSLFLLVGLVSGLLIKRLNILSRRIRETDLRSIYTNLYNANKLKQDLEFLIQEERPFALVTYHIINLEKINKYVDDQIISRLLQIISKDIKEAFPGHTCYSHGRSEYLVVMEAGEENYVEQKSMQFFKSFSEPIKVDEYELQLLVKAGLVKYPNHAQEAFDIISCVRSAMDQEDIYKSGFYYYNENIDKINRLNFEVTNALNRAIKDEDFYLVYQPKYCLHTQSVCGVEALIRWDRKGDKPIGPDVFIKVAEEIGFIDDISMWVAKECARQMQHWKQKGMEFNVSINLTSREMTDPLFCQRFHRIFREADIDASQIEIEITERVVVESNSSLKKNLKKYRDLGYKIAIDDYGTGYNTHFTMGEMDVDVVKIDKYFVDRLDRLEIRVLVQSIINYVHQLDKEVVAEGVETEKQMKTLESMGCDIIQGYYFSKPLAPDAITPYYDQILHLRYKSQNYL